MARRKTYRARGVKQTATDIHIKTINKTAHSNSRTVRENLTLYTSRYYEQLLVTARNNSIFNDFTVLYCADTAFRAILSVAHAQMLN
jgi:hypothetical protein